MGNRPRPSRVILPTIVFSQFAGTSLWFAGNAVLPDLQRHWALPDQTLGNITALVQLGFVAGTLVFAFLAIADRYSPRKVFALCSVLGALSNVLAVFLDGRVDLLLGLRFATGFFLAGIYPVGMKIASGWYRDDLGKALGWAVGAVVLGTAFPHLIRGLGHEVLPWEGVLCAVSLLALLGAAAMFALVPDGPYLAASPRFDPAAFAVIFRSRPFRASAFGYFGHMWELYAFWAFLPPLLGAYAAGGGAHAANASLWSFAIIAAGAVGCIGGGLAALRRGSASVAFAQLAVSGVCCMACGLAFETPPWVFYPFLLLWGIAVAGDSAQLSTLNARTAPGELVGSALTIVNCIGFALTIGSIQLLTLLAPAVSPQYLFALLIPGPALGLVALLPLLRGADHGR